jgi:hypothetical protein
MDMVPYEVHHEFGHFSRIWAAKVGVSPTAAKQKSSKFRGFSAFFGFFFRGFEPSPWARHLSGLLQARPCGLCLAMARPTFRPPQPISQVQLSTATKQ